MSGRMILVDLEYPRVGDNADEIEVGLCDVRAADSLRISYDFDRDGWVIKQASKFHWHDEEPTNSGWREVAFVPAWGSEVPCPECGKEDGHAKA